MTAATDVLRHLLARRRTNIEDAKSKQVSKKLKESDRNEKIELLTDDSPVVDIDIS